MASVFVSYSHRDGKDAVMTALRPLERQGVLALWADDRIPAGGDWLREIEEAVARATAAVLLVSPDFLASDFIVQNELPVLLARAEAGLLTLVPVFLRPSLVDSLEIDFVDLGTGAPRRVKLSKYQGVGTPSRPLAALKKVDRDRSYTGLAKQLAQMAPPGTGPTPPPGPTVRLPLPLQSPTPVIVQVAPPPTRRIPHELPPPAEEFFGRQTELRLLVERLRAGRNTAVVGPAGMGKTALAAEALREVTGTTPEALAGSPFPDGVVFLDLYTFDGQAEPAWNTLANRLDGAAHLALAPARERAVEACRARRILVVIEGGEEADGVDGRADVGELFSVLAPENRWLLLTRLSSQAPAAATVEVREALHPEDAERLLDALTRGRLEAAVRARVLGLLEGHPLALTWAGSLLGQDEDDPARLVGEWAAGRLPALSDPDPQRARHTLEWLFGRSVRGLDAPARQALTAVGLLAHAPVPLAAVAAALGDPGGEDAAREALKVLVRRGLLRRSGEADCWQLTHVLGYGFARQETGSDPELRERLGRWLHGHLAALLAPGVAGDPLALTRALEHTAALLRADDDQQLYWPLANYVLYGANDRLTALGRLALVKLAQGAVAGWFERFPVAKAEEAVWVRERSVLLDREGDVQSAQGDLPGALASYRESLAVNQRLAASDPSNTLWQRDLWASQIKVGNTLEYQGDLPSALASYRESLAVSQGLASSDSSNAEWQRDVWVSQINVGDVQKAQGDLPGAQASFRESLAVMQRLAASDPSNTLWQRDLSMSHIKVGDAQSAQGDLSSALASYRESLAVMQRLATSDPSNTKWQWDLSISHERVGDVQKAQGDVSGALASHRESLAVRQRLAASDPSNTQWQRDLRYTLNRLAEIHDQQGDRAEALRLAEESLPIAEHLAALDRTNVMWQKDVVVARALVARLRG